MKFIRIAIIFAIICTFPYFVSSEEKGTSVFGDILDGKGKVDPNEFLEGNGETVLEKHGKKERLGFLPLPPGYNKLIIPLANISRELFIQVHLSIREITNVDDENEFVEMDAELGISWIDWEIWKYFIEDKEAQAKAKDGPEEMTLDSEFLKQIWKPDIFIEQMASVDRTSILSKLIDLRFLVRNAVIPGSISFQSRQTFKIRCEMDFRFYPADVQVCPIHIRSYSYSQEQLFLMWNPFEKVFLDSMADDNFDYQVSDVEPGEKLYDLFTTSQGNCCNHRNFSTLTFNLKLRRNLMYHVIQTCLPSMLLVFITWLCFLLPPDMVEVRIGISMTTLLTMTAMFTAVREKSPDVSYPMAIDYWMVICVFLLFIALILFTVIYWLRQRVTKRWKDATAADHENNAIFGGASDKRRERWLVILGRYTFILFVAIFVIFLVIFSFWIMTGSQHYDWNPKPQYNAIPLLDENDMSNRLFQFQEKVFKPNTTKKVVESSFRFKDIFENVISKHLEELDEAE